MDTEESVPFVLKCTCGEVYVARVVLRLEAVGISEFTCPRCRTEFALPGAIQEVLRRTGGNEWEALDGG